MANPTADTPIAYFGTSPAACDVLMQRSAATSPITVSVPRFGVATTVGQFIADPSRGQWIWIRINGATAELIVDGGFLAA